MNAGLDGQPTVFATLELRADESPSCSVCGRPCDGFLLLRTLGVIQPTPQCSTPYGVDDTATCVYGDYAYRHGVQV